MKKCAVGGPGEHSQDVVDRSFDHIRKTAGFIAAKVTSDLRKTKNEPAVGGRNAFSLPRTFERWPGVFKENLKSQLHLFETNGPYPLGKSVDVHFFSQNTPRHTSDFIEHLLPWIVFIR